MAQSSKEQAANTAGWNATGGASGAFSQPWRVWQQKVSTNPIPLMLNRPEMVANMCKSWINPWFLGGILGGSDDETHD